MGPHEDQNEKAPSLEGKTEGHSFDELAKGLANNTISRRQAFKWFGVAIAGGLVASIPGLGPTSPPDRCRWW
jgi:hypothetical protein